MKPFDPTKFSGLGLLAGYKPNALHGILGDDTLPPAPPMTAFNALAPSGLSPMSLYEALGGTPPPMNALANLPPLPSVMTAYVPPPPAMTPYEPAQVLSAAEIVAQIAREEQARAAKILPDWRRRTAWRNTAGSIDRTYCVDDRARLIFRDAKPGEYGEWDADHIDPKGPDDATNLRALNMRSNRGEGDRT